MTATRWLRILVPVVAVIFLASYVGSYLVLSRRGYAHADEYGIKGFYYFDPMDNDAWRYKNYPCVILFWPLNTIDRAMGCGRHPAAEPLRGFD
jgi:hypothetical protein